MRRPGGRGAAGCRARVDNDCGGRSISRMRWKQRLKHRLSWLFSRSFFFFLHFGCLAVCPLICLPISISVRAVATLVSCADRSTSAVARSAKPLVARCAPTTARLCRRRRSRRHRRPTARSDTRTSATLSSRTCSEERRTRSLESVARARDPKRQRRKAMHEASHACAPRSHCLPVWGGRVTCVIRLSPCHPNFSHRFLCSVRSAVPSSLSTLASFLAFARRTRSATAAQRSRRCLRIRSASRAATTSPTHSHAPSCPENTIPSRRHLSPEVPSHRRRPRCSSRSTSGSRIQQLWLFFPLSLSLSLFFTASVHVTGRPQASPSPAREPMIFVGDSAHRSLLLSLCSPLSVWLSVCPQIPQVLPAIIPSRASQGSEGNVLAHSNSIALAAFVSFFSLSFLSLLSLALSLPLPLSLSVLFFSPSLSAFALAGTLTKTVSPDTLDAFLHCPCLQLSKFIQNKTKFTHKKSPILRVWLKANLRGILNERRSSGVIMRHRFSTVQSLRCEART